MNMFDALNVVRAMGRAIDRQCPFGISGTLDGHHHTIQYVGNYVSRSHSDSKKTLECSFYRVGDVADVTLSLSKRKDKHTKIKGNHAFKTLEDREPRVAEHLKKTLKAIIKGKLDGKSREEELAFFNSHGIHPLA